MSINVAGDDRLKVSGSLIDIEIIARCARTSSTLCSVSVHGGVTSQTAGPVSRSAWTDIRTWARELGQHLRRRRNRRHAEGTAGGENEFSSLIGRKHYHLPLFAHFFVCDVILCSGFSSEKISSIWRMFFFVSYGLANFRGFALQMYFLDADWDINSEKKFKSMMWLNVILDGP